MLAMRGIRWESEEHLAFADAVFERINYAAIRADTALAREKGCYALFEGSDWQTGAYFEKRGYASDKWRELAETVAAQGMRNAYLLAVAHLQHLHPLRHYGWDRPGHEALLFRGEEGQHPASRGPGAVAGYLVVL
jgi:hypothetical protein